MQKISVSVADIKKAMQDHFMREAALMQRLASISNDNIRNEMLLRFFGLQAHSNSMLSAVLVASGVDEKMMVEAASLGDRAATKGVEKAMQAAGIHAAQPAGFTPHIVKADATVAMQAERNEPGAELPDPDDVPFGEDDHDGETA